MAKPLTRRQFLQRIGALAALTWPALTRADTKASKASVHYRNHPLDHKMCSMCRYFLAPVGNSNGMMMRGLTPKGTMGVGHCQKVRGVIDPMGYCVLFTPRQRVPRYR